MAVRSNTLVLPAAMVTPPLAETQLTPLKYSSATLDGVSWVSVPTMALPSLKVGVKLMAWVLALLRLTVKTAKGEASLTVTLLTEIVGRSSSGVTEGSIVPSGL